MKKSHFFILTGLLLGSVIVSCPASAQDMLAKDIFQRAQKEYREGHVAAAKQELKKVLLVVPKHQGALAFLDKIYLEAAPPSSLKAPVVSPVPEGSPDIQKSQRKRKTQIARDMLVYLEREKQFLEQKLSQVTEERDTLWSSELAKDVSLDLLQQESKMTQAKFEQLQARRVDELSQVASLYNERLRRPVSMSRQSLIQQEMDIVDEDEVVRSIRRKLYNAVDQSSRYEEALSAAEEKNLHLETFMTARQVQTEKLLSVLKEYLRLKEDTLRDSEDALVTKEADLALSGQNILAKIDELIDVYAALQDYQSGVEDRDAFIDAMAKDLEFLQQERQRFELSAPESTQE